MESQTLVQFGINETCLPEHVRHGACVKTRLLLLMTVERGQATLPNLREF